MAGFREIRARVGQAVWPMLLSAVLAYFVYHAVHGDRGLLAQRRLEYQHAALAAELGTLRAERLRLEHKVGLMGSGDGLYDPDLLEERARATLGLVAPDEVVILRPGH